MNSLFFLPSFFSFLLLAIASLMLFGTCYDVYVHKPMEKSIRMYRQRANSENAAAARMPLPSQSWLILFIRMFSVVIFLYVYFFPKSKFHL
jgi:hypothetical protein